MKRLLLLGWFTVFGCGSPFTAASLASPLEEESETSVVTPSVDGRVSAEASVVVDAAAPAPDVAPLGRDVLSDPWPADVVVEPWPCINCVPTFSGTMACCFGNDPNRTCNGHEGARYCEGCGCP